MRRKHGGGSDYRLAANMTDLAGFLARHQSLAEETAVWRDGLIHLRITGYLSDELPPTEYVTSVRAVVFQGDSVLAFRDRYGIHVLPGGRREPDETLEETLRREVLEETGCRIAGVSQLGFAEFRHLTPKPPDYPYPYPDFLQIVCLAEAVDFIPEARIPDEYVEESFFQPLDQIDSLTLTPSERLFLDAAIRMRIAGVSHDGER